MNINKFKNKLKSKLNGEYLIVAINNYGKEINKLTYIELYKLIKNNSIKIIKNEKDYNTYYECNDILLLKLNKNDISLCNFSNKDYKIIEYVLNMFNTYEERTLNTPLKNIIGVRWLGAFNTETTTIKHSFKECLEWEFSAKDREVACDLFADFTDYNFINCYKERKYNSYDNLYSRCKLGFIYNEEKIRRAYCTDVWSRQLGTMLVGTNNEYYENVIESGKDLINLTYHAEGFIYANVKPDYILIVDKDKWSTKNLKLVEEFASKNNIITIYINSNFDKNFEDVEEEALNEDLQELEKVLEKVDDYWRLDFSYIEYLLEYKEFNKYDLYKNIDRLY